MEGIKKLLWQMGNLKIWEFVKRDTEVWGTSSNRFNVLAFTLNCKSIWTKIENIIKYFISFLLGSMKVIFLLLLFKALVVFAYKYIGFEFKYLVLFFIAIYCLKIVIFFDIFKDKIDRFFVRNMGNDFVLKRDGFIMEYPVKPQVYQSDWQLIALISILMVGYEEVVSENGLGLKGYLKLAKFYVKDTLSFGFLTTAEEAAKVNGIIALIIFGNFIWDWVVLPKLFPYKGEDVESAENQLIESNRTTMHFIKELRKELDFSKHVDVEDNNNVNNNNDNSNNNNSSVNTVDNNVDISEIYESQNKENNHNNGEIVSVDVKTTEIAETTENNDFVEQKYQKNIVNVISSNIKSTKWYYKIFILLVMLLIILIVFGSHS